MWFNSIVLIFFQREQDEVSRNSSQSSNNHSYDEVDSVYYHSVEWRNYNFESPASAIIDTHDNADSSVGSNHSEKAGDDPDPTRSDIAGNSYMELVWVLNFRQTIFIIFLLWNYK